MAAMLDGSGGTAQAGWGDQASQDHDQRHDDDACNSPHCVPLRFQAPAGELKVY